MTKSKSRHENSDQQGCSKRNDDRKKHNDPQKEETDYDLEFDAEPDDKLYEAAERVGDWLISKRFLPSWVMPARKAKKWVIVIIYDGDIDVSKIPTETPIVVLEKMVEELEDNLEASTGEESEVTEVEDFGEFEHQNRLTGTVVVLSHRDYNFTNPDGDELLHADDTQAEASELMVIENEEHSAEIDAIAVWLVNNNFVPSAVTIAKRGHEDVMEIYFNGEIEITLLPTSLPVVVLEDRVEELDDEGEKLNHGPLKKWVARDNSDADQPEADTEDVDLDITEGDKFASDVDVVGEWLIEHNIVPSWVTIAKRGDENVVVVFHEGAFDIDTSVMPTDLPVLVCEQGVEELVEDNGFNIYRRPQPGPGSSIGTRKSRCGTLGMYLRSGKSYYILTCGHVLLAGRNNPESMFMLDKTIVTNCPALGDYPNGKAMVKEYLEKYEHALQQCHQAKPGSKREQQELCEKMEKVRISRGVWRRRKSYLHGPTKLCEGGVGEKGQLCKLASKHTSSTTDWAIAKVTQRDRLPDVPNQILIGNRLLPFRSGYKDPKPGMIVCKSGRSTGVTFGKVSGSRILALGGHPGNDKTKDWFFSCLKKNEVQEILRKDGGLRCIDGRKIRLEEFIERGDSGSVILSYPDLTPVGLLFAGRPKPHGVGMSVGIFMPMRQVLERIKKLTGITFTL